MRTIGSAFHVVFLFSAALSAASAQERGGLIEIPRSSLREYELREQRELLAACPGGQCGQGGGQQQIIRGGGGRRPPAFRPSDVIVQLPDDESTAPPRRPPSKPESPSNSKDINDLKNEIANLKAEIANLAALRAEPGPAGPRGPKGDDGNTPQVDYDDLAAKVAEQVKAMPIKVRMLDQDGKLRVVNGKPQEKDVYLGGGMDFKLVPVPIKNAVAKGK